MFSPLVTAIKDLFTIIRWLVGCILFSVEYGYHVLMGYCLRWKWKGYPIFQQLVDPKANPMMSFHEGRLLTDNSLDAPSELRIGSLNFHYGNCRDELVHWCRDFDICCLQEVVGNSRRNVSLLDKLSQQTEYNYHYYQKDYHFNHWSVGNGTISRVPWLDLRVYYFERWWGRPDRHAIATKFQVADSQVWVVQTHFQHDWTGLQQEYQFDELEKWLGNLEGPCILLGDFNYPIPILKRFFSYQDISIGNTYPTIFPIFHLDRVFVNTEAVELFHLEVVVGSDRLSDHLPLSVFLRKKKS